MESVSKAQEQNYKQFLKFGLKRNLDDDTFPHAKTGLALFRAIRKTLVFAIWFAILGFLIKLGASLIPIPEAYHFSGSSVGLGGGGAAPSAPPNPNDPFAQVDSSSNPLSKITDSLSSNGGDGEIPFNKWTLFFVNLFNGIGDFLYVLAIIVGVICAVLIVFYVVTTVMRWRSWERHCLINDWRSEQIRRNVIRRGNLKRYIREAKEGVKKGNGGESKVSRSVEATLEAHKALKKLRVFVNTRNSMDSPVKVIRHYRMVLEIPSSYDAADIFVKSAESLGPTANSAAKIHFGQMRIAQNGRTVEFVDRAGVKDWYARRDDTKKSGSSLENAEVTFSTKKFKDHSEENEEHMMYARRWADSKAMDLDKMLETLKMEARRSRVAIGGATANVVYDLSYGLASEFVDSLPEKVDKTMKLVGTSAKIEAGELHISIRMPSEFKQQLDLPKLYGNYFG